MSIWLSIKTQNYIYHPGLRTLATLRNQVLQGSLDSLAFHLPPTAFFTNPLLTRDQEPQWVEYSGPRVGMLQRHLANCLKDKKDVW